MVLINLKELNKIDHDLIIEANKIVKEKGKDV